MEDKLSESKVRRLAYIKSMFRLGLENLSRQNSPGAGAAILIFDNCLEAMFWLLCDKYGIRTPEQQRGQYSWQLIQKVIDISKNKVLENNKSALSQLHSARNGVQHNGLIPELSFVEQFRAVTETILTDLALSEFGIAWGLISIGVLIDDPIVKDLYIKAEDHFSKKEYHYTAISLVAAFEFTKSKEQYRRSGSFITWSRGDARKISEKSESSELKQLAKYTLTIEKELEILKLGIDYKGFRKYHDAFNIDPFDSLGFSLSESNADEVIQIVTNKYGSSVPFKEYGEAAKVLFDEWLDFAFDFVMDNILRWQSTFRPSIMDMLSLIGRSEEHKGTI